MSTTAIAVPDMHCASCSAKVGEALGQLDAVEGFSFNPVRRHVVVSHGDHIGSAELLAQVERAGFTPNLLEGADKGSDRQREQLKRIGVAGLALMQIMTIHVALYAGVFEGMEAHWERLLEWAALCFCIPVMSYSALPFLINATMGLKRGVNMDLPIALAICLAFVASVHATLTGTGEPYYDSVAMFTFLMLGARYLEQRMRDRLDTQDDLLALLPQEVLIQRDGLRERVALENIQPQDRLWIEEGDTLPADGLLVDATALIDEACLTGESQWAEKRRGAPLFAGTTNCGGAFELEVTQTGSGCRIGQIDRSAHQALEVKQQIARIADRVARWFVPIILIVAGATWLAWQQIDPGRALEVTLAVLIVTCPCALSLAAPAAVTAALSRLRQAGVLVKNPGALERCTQVRHVGFDKTGTLTEAQLSLLATTAEPGYDGGQCLSMAAAIQRHSSHPIARAFRHVPTSHHAEGVEMHPGQGISATVEERAIRIGSRPFTGWPGAAKASRHQRIHMTIDGQPAATFTLEAPLRADARSTLKQLERDGRACLMISGDTEQQCERLADELGIPYVAEQMPEAKSRWLESNDSLYVGDGINDLPALTQATVSIATLETSDLVKSRADMVMLTGRLSALLDLFRISARTTTILRQNVLWAVAYNALAIPAALLGYAPPWVAALGMSASSLIVLANASRVLRTPIGAQ